MFVDLPATYVYLYVQWFLHHFLINDNNLTITSCYCLYLPIYHLPWRGSVNKPASMLPWLGYKGIDIKVILLQQVHLFDYFLPNSFKTA